MVENTLILLPPCNRIEEIAYQTILKTYYATILQEYENVSKGCGVKILEMINSDIDYLHQSKQNWIAAFNREEDWEDHLSKVGWNTREFFY